MRLRARRQQIGIGLFCLLLVGLSYLAGTPDVTAPPPHYFLSAPVWALVAAAAIASLALMSAEDATLNLILAWGVMGVVALYFPALFQRKLAMGLSVPWAILATLGFKEFVKKAERNTRNLAAVLVILLLAATSISWIIRREPYLIRRDVSNTTVHDVFLGHDEREILRRLDERSGVRTVVLAMPGVPSPEMDAEGNRIPDEFAKPAIPDLNPIVSGLTGCYTYCGHWSETPDYERRRSEASKVFLAATSDVQRRDILARIQPDYIIEPSSETFGNQIEDLSGLGEVVYRGTKFQLIKITR